MMREPLSHINDMKNIEELAQSSGNAISQTSFQEILDSEEDELLGIDADYRIQFANSSACKPRKLDKPPIGRLCYEALQGRDRPCSSPLWACPLKDVLKSGTTTTVIYPAYSRGVDAFLRITAHPLHDGQGNLTGIVELRRDITAEREREAQKFKRYHQLLALSRISSAVSSLRDMNAILTIALDNVLEIINGATGGIFLLDEGTGKLRYSVHRGLSAKYTDNVSISLGEGVAGRVAQTGKPILLEDISKNPSAHSDLIRREGLKGFVSIPLKVEGKVVGVIDVASREVGRFGADDVSLLSSIGDYLGTAIEQVRLYERLARVGERNRVLLRYALTAQEEERKRIARELHDETSQALASLALRLQAMIEMAESKGLDAEFIQELKAVHSNAIQAGQETIRLMKELRPTLLDELGMAAAINRYAMSTLEPQGIKVSTEFAGTDRRLAPEVEATLFRIAQGVLANILEHAGAKNVSIKLKCDTNECILEIRDDGQGFDVSRLRRAGPSGRGAGLFIMRERASMLGGAAYVESAPGQGTKVIVKAPISTGVPHEEGKSTDSR